MAADLSGAAPTSLSKGFNSFFSGYIVQSTHFILLLEFVESFYLTEFLRCSFDPLPKAMPE